MSADFPRSSREAEEHIHQIRCEKGLGGRMGEIAHNAADLEAALEVLSADLYQTATHFLLELIQNADDNQYDEDLPTLRITHSPRRIRIDCNERGFSRQNVEAICRICQSTKSGRSKAAGFVGEKGIGFKAVFKVASTVSIASGHYQFKFERDGHLGMIAPIWAPFPETMTPGWTSFLMDLDDHCNEAAIVKELRQYDARVLMFLRRLCRLEISVKHEQKESSRSSRLWAKINKNTDEAAPPLPSRDAFAKVFTRMGQGHFSSGPSIMNLAENDDVKQYLVWRHTAEKLPPETRRPGMSRSEVVLAFPLCQDGQTPEIAPQSVYAFLPIRQYGFDFLLQADFLLSTNREDILVDSPWNQTLASAVSDAFVNAVVGMSGFPKGNILRYAWISYLPSTTPLSPLMRDIRDDIFRRLRNTPVIHTQQVYGKLRSPVGLTIVPDLYRDPDGVPFALSGDGRGFVSREYSWVYSDAKNSTLEQLGVKTMNDEDFMALMVAVLGNDPVAFYRGKTPEWHASFCNSLHTTIQNTIRTFDLLWTSTPTSQHLLDLPIIPLRGGTWATPLVTPWESPLISTGSTIHYADTSSGAAEIPEGIFIRVVDPEAACNPDRRRLFDLLGVTKMNDSTIRTAIICTHTSETFKPDSLEPRVLASHLAFMFYSGWKTDAHKTCDFWVASAKGECRLASTMYIPSNAPGAAYRVLSQAGRDKDCRFLHPAYMDQVVEKEKLGDWMGWLLENTKIALHPRIYNSGPATLSVLHPDFRPLLESNVPSMRVLTLLRDGWDYYKAFLDISIKAADSIIPYNRFLELSELVRDVVVPCRGSTSFAPLRSTYMPNSSLASQYLGLVPLLDLPDLENPTWAPVLKGLRIQDEPDLRFYLECLRGCRNDPNVSVGTVQTLMRNIETEAANDLVELRKAFGEEYLICIPPREKGVRLGWVRSDQCVWKGEPWMVKFHVLSKHYPDLGALFQSSLLIPDAGIQHIVEEAVAVPETVAEMKSVGRIEKILHALTSHLIRNSNDDNINMFNSDSELNPEDKAKLRRARMFPIHPGKRNQHFERLSSAEDKDTWLIADRAIFWTQFRGKVPILALDAGTILRIRPLLVAIGLHDRFLSHVATNITEAHGDVTLLEDVTMEYQRRSKFLFRLMQPGQPNEGQLRAKFRSVEVFSAATITQYWRAPFGLQQVQSAPTTGKAFLESDYFGNLRIYMPPGYEMETYPFELAEQIREFFTIAAEHRDLVLLALASEMERVEELFSSRGFGPLPEESVRNERENDEWTLADNDEPDMESLTLDDDTPQENRNADGKKKSHGSSRFGRMLNRKRFHPSFFNQDDDSPDSLPSYSRAVARTTQGATSSRTVHPARKLPPAFTLSLLESTITDMEFHQKDGAIVGAPLRPSSVLGFIKGLAQRDVNMGETIVSNALSVILGPQYDPDTTWTPRNERKPGHSAFIFTDSQGRFGSFLMRLEGRTGKAQGYTKLTYHLDVKVTDKPQVGEFDLTQEELDKARYFSVHTDEELNAEPNKQVSILVHISNVRAEPEILFLVDPWDLFKDGQLILKTATKYRASLRLRSPEMGESAEQETDGGFDVVQFRQHGSPRRGPPGDAPPAYSEDKGKGVSSAS